jgi:cytochrome c-type biogenesis protein CcmE
MASFRICSVKGRLDDSGVLATHTVLAKHDENHMPPEIAETFEKHGYDAEQSSL